MRGNVNLGNLCGYSSFPLFVSANMLGAGTVTMTSVIAGTSSNVALATSSGASMIAGCLVGTNEAQQHVIAVYPNPASDVVTISTGQLQGGEFVMYNAAGQIVLRQQLVQSTTTVSVQELARGVYFYRVTEESGRMYSGKLVRE
jgi:hypothetical protein